MVSDNRLLTLLCYASKRYCTLTDTHNRFIWVLMRWLLWKANAWPSNHAEMKSFAFCVLVSPLIIISGLLITGKPEPNIPSWRGKIFIFTKLFDSLSALPKNITHCILIPIVPIVLFILFVLGINWHPKKCGLACILCCTM